MKTIAPILCVLFCSMTIGCNSFTSTILNRMDDNSYHAESNGQPLEHGQARPFKGIPITLKVPTHLDIYIDETYFLQITAEEAKEVVGDSTRLLSVRTETIKSDKVFTVDFKRPAAGFLDLKIDFDEDEQYFKKIVSELQDDTITETANLIGAVIENFGGLQASTGSDEDIQQALATANVIRDKRVVAYQRFDINSPSFEYEVEQFVNYHLNDCNRCGTSPDYDRAPGVSQLPYTEGTVIHADR